MYSQAHVNGTDHHISGSSCDQISPARRTKRSSRTTWKRQRNHAFVLSNRGTTIATGAYWIRNKANPWHFNRQ